METKTCIICNEPQMLKEFAVSKGYIANQCRTCANRKRNEKRSKKKAGLIVVATDQINNMICDYCHLEVSKTLFRPQSRKCASCLKVERYAYTQSEHGKEKQGEWRDKNKEIISKQQSEWRNQNREKINEKRKQKYHSDHDYRFKQLCSRRIRIAFKDKGMEKSDKTITYLNCTIPWLTEWFKFCFTPEMTIDNHGEYWHMDHVIPVNTFNLNDPEQVELCLSWFNLSPLEARENISKHDSINVQQIERHVHNLICFNNLYNIDKYFDLCARHLTMNSGSPLEPHLPLLQGNL